jgi:hypothetical protein
MARARMIGGERVKALLANLHADLESEMDAALEQEAEDLASAIRGVTPEITGALLRSVRVEKDPKWRLTYYVKVGGVPETRKKVRKGVHDSDFAHARKHGGFTGEFDYTLAVEFGHLMENGEKVPAEPFIYPTFRARRQRMQRRLRATYKRVVNSYDTRSSKGG